MSDTNTAEIAVGGSGAEPVNSQNTTQEQIKTPDFKGTKHKVKVDNVELEIPYEDLVSDYQLKKASTERFQKASEMMKQAQAVESLLAQAQKGDLSWLKGLVPNEQLVKWAESELLQHIEYEELPPEQKELRRLKQEKQDLENRWKQREESERNQRLSALNEQAVKDVDIEIANAIKELGHDVKVTPRLIKRIAEQMESSLEEALSLSPEQASAYQPIPAKIASERAFRGFDKDVEEYLQIASVDKILKILPPKLREAIRKADVESVTSQLPFGVRGNKNDEMITENSTPKKTKLKKMSTDEYFKRMDKVMGS